jgi:hypothetical protein
MLLGCWVKLNVDVEKPRWSVAIHSKSGRCCCTRELQSCIDRDVQLYEGDVEHKEDVSRRSSHLDCDDPMHPVRRKDDGSCLAILAIAFPEISIRPMLPAMMRCPGAIERSPFIVIIAISILTCRKSKPALGALPVISEPVRLGNENEKRVGEAPFCLLPNASLPNW